MKNKKKIIAIILSIIVVLGAIVAVYVVIKNNKSEPVVEIVPVEVDNIDGYEYKLEDRDSKLYKELFSKLKKTLESEVIDYREFALLISKLYIVDLYTINNKVSKYDVGGLEFVLPNARDNYSLKVEDTIYKYVEDNSNGKRKQDLPEVKSIELLSADELSIKVGETEYDGYKVDLTWDYQKDYGYDKEASINLVIDDTKVYVVEQINKSIE